MLDLIRSVKRNEADKIGKIHEQDIFHMKLSHIPISRCHRHIVNSTLHEQLKHLRCTEFAEEKKGRGLLSFAQLLFPK